MVVAEARDQPAAVDPIDVMAVDALLSEEERAVRERVRSWVLERFEPRIAGLFERAEWPLELVRELGALGVLGMHLDGYGCGGRSAVEYGLACLELEAGDTGLRTFVSVQGSLAMTAIHQFGDEEQKQHWLPRMAAGEAIGCFGLTEPTGGSDPRGMLTTARRDGDGWVLDGSKRWIGMGSIADVAVVWAKVDDVVRGFLVPKGTPGFTAHDITGKMSLRASIQSELHFDGCRVGDDALLPGAKGLRGPLTCLNEARYGILWGVMGAARSCYATALDYAREREQFGKPIGAFQLIQQKLVDMMLELNKGMLLALQIGRLMDDGRVLPQHISVGKLNNTREALAIARESRAILGGNGITLEYPIIRHMNNLESVLTYEGTSEIHTLVLGHAVTGLRAYA